MKRYFSEAASPTFHAWDVLWSYAIMKCDGLCVNPTSNLVQNIGFSEGATTERFDSFKLYSEFLARDMFEVVSPMEVCHDLQADVLYFESLIKITDPRLIKKIRPHILDSFISLIRKITNMGS
jgi:hypothetical protein